MDICWNTRFLNYGICRFKDDLGRHMDKCVLFLNLTPMCFMCLNHKTKQTRERLKSQARICTYTTDVVQQSKGIKYSSTTAVLRVWTSVFTNENKQFCCPYVCTDQHAIINNNNAHGVIIIKSAYRSNHSWSHFDPEYHTMTCKPEGTWTSMKSSFSAARVGICLQ